MVIISVSYITPASILVISILLPILATITLAGRFWIRRDQKSKILWDDWLLIGALLLIWGTAIAQIYSESQGALGYPKGLPPDAPLEEQFFWLKPKDVVYQQTEYAIQLIEPLALGCIKASFILFYRRIFVTGHRTWFSIFTMTMLVLIGIWSLAFCLAFILRCGNNLWANWDTIESLVLYCPAAFGIQESFAISDFIMDVIVLLAPISAISRLHMDLSRKLSILGIFALGLFATAASLVRMVIVIIVTNTGFDPTVDGDLEIGAVLFWSMVEDCTALIAACLPTMSVIIKKGVLGSKIKSARDKLSSLRLMPGSTRRTESKSSIIPGNSKISISSENYNMERMNPPLNTEGRVAYFGHGQDEHAVGHAQ